MSAKRFLSTGEAAKALDLSRATVTRMFDHGRLAGRKNPITGKRQISIESLKIIVDKYRLSPTPMPIETKSVLVCTSDDGLPALISKAVPNDERVLVDGVKSGADALVLVSKLRPDLLIVQDVLPDIAGAEVIKAIRRAGDVKDLKILCLSHGEMAEQCLQSGADAYVTNGSANSSDVVSKALKLLGIEEKPAIGPVFEHERRWGRMRVRLAATIQVYPVKSPRRRSHGRATIDDIGPGGAHLSNIQIEEQRLPAEPFEMLVKVNQAPLVNWQARCRILRLDAGDTLAAGVVFSKISARDAKKLSALTT